MANKDYIFRQKPGPKNLLTPIQEHKASDWYIMRILMHEKFSAKILAEYVEKEMGIKISPWMANTLAHNAIEDAVNHGLISDIRLYRAKAAKTAYYGNKKIKEIKEKKESELKEKEGELKGLKESIGLKF